MTFLAAGNITNYSPVRRHATFRAKCGEEIQFPPGKDFPQGKIVAEARSVA
jgi:hypothetical protein